MVAVVQAQQGTNGGTGTAATVTLSSPTTAGNALIVLAASVASTTNGTISGVTLGGAAGNFAALASQGSGTDHAVVAAWADPGCAGGQTSVAVSTAGSSGTECVLAWAFEVSGLPSSGLLDQTAVLSSTGSVSSWTLGPTPATTQASEIWFGIAAGNVSSTSTGTYTGPSSPWVNQPQQGVANYGGSGFSFGGIAGYQVVSSAGTASYNGSASPASTIEGLVVTVKAAAGALPAPTLAAGGRMAARLAETYRFSV